MNRYVLLSGAVVVCLLMLATAADAQPRSGDLRDLATATCELAGLVVTPGEGWVNMPVQVTTSVSRSTR